MPRKNARVLPAVLAALLFIGSAFSCAGQSEQSSAIETKSDTASAETTETSILDTLPEKNLGGETIRALARITPGGS